MHTNRPYKASMQLCSFSNSSQTLSWENYVVFLLLFCLVANLNPPHTPPLSHRKDSWNCSFTERKKLKAGTFFFSVRFVKIIPIMILLATGRMWLLKMDLWKNSYPQKNIGGWTNPSPPHPAAPSTELIPSANSIQEATFVFSRPTSLKVIIPDHKYHFTFPAGSFPGTLRLLRRSWFGKGLICPSTCSFCNQPLPDPQTAGYQR